MFNYIVVFDLFILFISIFLILLFRVISLIGGYKIWVDRNYDLFMGIIPIILIIAFIVLIEILLDCYYNYHYI